MPTQSRRGIGFWFVLLKAFFFLTILNRTHRKTHVDNAISRLHVMSSFPRGGFIFLSPPLFDVSYYCRGLYACFLNLVNREPFQRTSKGRKTWNGKKVIFLIRKGGQSNYSRRRMDPPGPEKSPWRIKWFYCATKQINTNFGGSFCSY